MAEKLNYSFVKASFEEKGYKLITQHYTNSKAELECICSKGHKYKTTWTRWCSGHGCPYCAGNAKHDITNIRKAFEEEGYMLLSDNYINSGAKLSYICPNKHEGTISWDSWRRGSRCRICSYIFKRSGPNSSLWKGGVSFEPYCPIWKDQEYKQDIRKRDGNKCSNPYCASDDPGDLTIHHIDYNKKNCHPSNLITVCRACNSRANKDRRWHKAWYQAIIYRRYDYGNGKH